MTAADRSRADIDIETAAAADIAELCRLLGLLFAQETEFAADVSRQQRGLQTILQHPELGTLLVAKQQGRIVGMVNLLFTVSTALGARVALLEDVVVLPELRGCGVGSRLIEAAIATARTTGCKRITLLTDTDNQTAQAFYRKHGFAPSSMLAMRLLLDD